MGQGSGNDLPTVQLTEDDFTDGAIDVLTLLVKAELCSSKSDARRNVQQGGVTIENEKITNIDHTLSREEIAEGILVRKGKKSFCRVIC